MPSLQSNLPHRFLRVGAIFLLVVGAFCARADTTSSAALQKLFANYYEENLALAPIDAAEFGDDDPRYENVWPNDISPEYRAKVRALAEKYLAQLNALDRSGLSASERLSCDTLRWSLTTRAEEAKQWFHLMPVNQFYGPPLSFAQMASGASIHPFKTSNDYRNFLGRARGFAEWVDTAIANMREGIAKGIVQPRALMVKVLPQLEPLMLDDPEKNILFGALKQLPAAWSEKEKATLAAEYRDGLRAIALPAYRKLHDFIRDEYLPHCRATSGLGDLPGGAEAYAQRVRQFTTTDLSADEVHEIGLREVARIHGEMEAVRKEVGFKGTLTEFLADVATNPRFTPFKTDEEVLDAYRAVEGSVMANIPKLFGQVPRTRFEIRATEKFRAASASAQYSPGKPDGSRPGVFYVPIVDPTKISTIRMESLFLHEAIPGHHFQLSLTSENTSLPRFRRYDGNSAFMEGWALYCERLGSELGLYRDPYERFGMLLGELQRAVRLVVDTGIHAKGWSREKALEYEAAQEGGSVDRYIAGIERYMAIPGQALSYKIGQLKFLELRATAERKLGARFDLRQFHDLVLSEGTLPLSVLEAHVRDWIAQQ